MIYHGYFQINSDAVTTLRFVSFDTDNSFEFDGEPRSVGLVSGVSGPFSFISPLLGMYGSLSGIPSSA